MKKVGLLIATTIIIVIVLLLFYENKTKCGNVFAPNNIKDIFFPEILLTDYQLKVINNEKEVILSSCIGNQIMTAYSVNQNLLLNVDTGPTHIYEIYLVIKDNGEVASSFKIVDGYLYYNSVYYELDHAKEILKNLSKAF